MTRKVAPANLAISKLKDLWIPIVQYVFVLKTQIYACSQITEMQSLKNSLQSNLQNFCLIFGILFLATGRLLNSQWSIALLMGFLRSFSDGFCCRAWRLSRSGLLVIVNNTTSTDASEILELKFCSTNSENARNARKCIIVFCGSNNREKSHQKSYGPLRIQ